MLHCILTLDSYPGHPICHGVCTVFRLESIGTYFFKKITTTRSSGAIQVLLRGDAVISADEVYIATALYGQARECNKTRNNGMMITGAIASVGVQALGLFRGITFICFFG